MADAQQQQQQQQRAMLPGYVTAVGCQSMNDPAGGPGGPTEQLPDTPSSVSSCTFFCAKDTFQNVAITPQHCLCFNQTTSMSQQNAAECEYLCTVDSLPCGSSDHLDRFSVYSMDLVAFDAAQKALSSSSLTTTTKPPSTIMAPAPSISPSQSTSGASISPAATSALSSLTAFTVTSPATSTPSSQPGSVPASLSSPPSQPFYTQLWGILMLCALALFIIIMAVWALRFWRRRNTKKSAAGSLPAFNVWRSPPSSSTGSSDSWEGSSRGGTVRRGTFNRISLATIFGSTGGGGAATASAGGTGPRAGLVDALQQPDMQQTVDPEADVSSIRSVPEAALVKP